MLGSTIINHRQHVGLQKLSALAGITHSSLGPNKKYKFIQDDTSGESTLVCSCFRIFENLELTCAVGQLVYETIQAHQKVYHTGSGCLLFLAGAWSRAALECLQRGISVAHIISAMSEGMEICLDVCRKCNISTEGLGVEQSENCTATSNAVGLQLSKKPIVEVSQASCYLQGTANDGHKTLNTIGQRKIKLSRHFCEAKSENVSTVLQPHQPKLPDIAHLAEGLSHGCVDAMNLVVKASQIQSKNNQQDISCFMFDVTKVVTCVLPGLPEDHACVLPGCIVVLSAEQASVAHHLKEQHLNVALINGDLSDTYRHLGFNRPTGVQCVSNQSNLSSSSKEQEWMEKVVTLLLNLDVNLILVSGLVSEKVIQHCCRHHILVVEKVKASVLKAFANATGAVPVTYATQLSKHCVGTGVKVVIWRDLSSHERKPLTTVNISTGGNSELVTVILTSCLTGKLQALEDQFWTCAYRLHHVLKDKVLLPGAGVTEMLCVHRLQKQAEHHVKHHGERNGDSVQHTKAGTAANPYRGVVLHLLADGLIDYISTVVVNTGRFSKVRARTAVSQQLQEYNESLGIAAKVSQLFLEGEQGDSAFPPPMKTSEAPAVKIYDNLSVKQEAWRKALDLVFLVLQADAEVITGIDQKTDGAQENLMLL
ncbi:Bardet-Biedl syndrome 12 protein isoform X2 [Siniperca chuatsi]|nr:Bardet-Biedl syndrome 12 protein isoform X2 [Siniperca chuatsi]XP_044060353.1 Bardet-Biedl syndrome 12 protein isoform X2 [Siniperca chuatsi]XP_044060354.1 Bardet-Biedl syndrome 12 protein isoform X2 [Siniperca chuatsi]XP_044060355.1 Bardet-Biedl syndrome 12 protein isoform X2 [Siniperca chuatsi]XP_044060356.1 Bardet-Biedl syndrome 12 protein isoform X2 [Siniperca chuatsi]